MVHKIKGIGTTAVALIAVVLLVIGVVSGYYVGGGAGTTTMTVTGPVNTVTDTLTSTVTEADTLTTTKTVGGEETVTETVAKTSTVTQTATETLTPTTTATTTALVGKPGGTFIIGVEKDEPSLDPIFAQAGVSSDTIQNAIYETLVIYDYDMRIVPRLAESFEQVDDLTYIFKLRTGVKFHDGTPLDATAAKWHFDRIMTVSSPRQGNIGMVDRVEVVDDSTIKFVLKHPSAEFLANIAFSMGLVSPTAVEKYGEDYGTTAAVGTGPFKFVEWAKGDHITLVRNEDYWGTKPYLDEIVIRIIPEVSVRSLELERGGIQAAQLEPSDAIRLKDSDTVDIIMGPANRVIMLSINMNADMQSTPALLNKNVRQAISYAVDRNALVQSVREGFAVPGIGVINPSMKQFWNPSLQVYPSTADIGKAKQLLAEAGYSDGFEFTLLNFFPWGLPVATIVQAQLAEVGITMNINNMEFGAGATQMLVDRKYDMSLNDWAGPGAPTPNAVMGEFYDPAMVGPWQWNMHNVNDPIMAFIVGELALQTDLAAAKGLSDAAQRKVIDEAWGTFLYYPNRLHASSSSVNGYDMHPHPWYGFVLSMDVFGVNVWIE